MAKYHTPKGISASITECVLTAVRVSEGWKTAQAAINEVAEAAEAVETLTRGIELAYTEYVIAQGKAYREASGTVAIAKAVSEVEQCVATYQGLVDDYNQATLTHATCAKHAQRVILPIFKKGF